MKFASRFYVKKHCQSERAIQDDGFDINTAVCGMQMRYLQFWMVANSGMQKELDSIKEERLKRQR